MTAPIHRWCLAAAHIAVRDTYEGVPHTVESPGTPAELSAAIDWQATRTIRQRLIDRGFGIAEAMDTAQRFAIGWDIAEQLIALTASLAPLRGFIAGAGDDSARDNSDDALVESVVTQARAIQAHGGFPIVLPLRGLCVPEPRAERFEAVYRAIIDALDGPLFLHWLGSAFLPSVAGYFPGESFHRIMAYAPEKVRGVKISLLDAEAEQRIRDRILPDGQIVLTGDDFHFASLIAGDEIELTGETRIGRLTVTTGRFSHALLGVLDGIAKPASVALSALAVGDRATYDALMGPCEALGQCLFEAPTQFYKSGLAYLAWRDGVQPNAMLLNHEERLRDAEYYRRVEALALRAGVFEDADRLTLQP